MAEVVIPEIKHEYIRQVDTETTKNDWFDECIADNKEAAWAGIGTGELDSQYQPSPVKEPDYYMQYCSSDDYDYLKDYRLIWGYGIGIIEQDVICSLSTGEHLAEGVEACDAYEAENAAGKDVDWKRGTWLKFSGNRNVSPARIGEVILPSYIISLKDLCSALQVDNYECKFEWFYNNEASILNINNLCSQKRIKVDISNYNTYVDFIDDGNNIKTAEYAFAYADVGSVEDDMQLFMSQFYNCYNFNHIFYNGIFHNYENSGGLLHKSPSNIILDSAFENCTFDFNDDGNSSLNYFNRLIGKSMYKNAKGCSFSFGNSGGNIVFLPDCSSCFEGCKIGRTGSRNEVTDEISWGGLDFSKVTNAKRMFYNTTWVNDEVFIDLSSVVEHEDGCFSNFFNTSNTNKIFNIKSPSVKLKGSFIFGDVEETINRPSIHNCTFNIINTLYYYNHLDNINATCDINGTYLFCVYECIIKGIINGCNIFINLANSNIYYTILKDGSDLKICTPNYTEDELKTIIYNSSTINHIAYYYKNKIPNVVYRTNFINKINLDDYYFVNAIIYNSIDYKDAENVTINIDKRNKSFCIINNIGTDCIYNIITNNNSNIYLSNTYINYIVYNDEIDNDTRRQYNKILINNEEFDNNNYGVIKYIIPWAISNMGGHEEPFTINAYQYNVQVLNENTSYNNNIGYKMNFSDIHDITIYDFEGKNYTIAIIAKTFNKLIYKPSVENSYLYYENGNVYYNDKNYFYTSVVTGVIETYLYGPEKYVCPGIHYISDAENSNFPNIITPNGTLYGHYIFAKVDNINLSDAMNYFDIGTGKYVYNIRIDGVKNLINDEEEINIVYDDKQLGHNLIIHNENKPINVTIEKNHIYTQAVSYYLQVAPFDYYNDNQKLYLKTFNCKEDLTKGNYSNKSHITFKHLYNDCYMTFTSITQVIFNDMNNLTELVINGGTYIGEINTDNTFNNLTKLLINNIQIRNDFNLQEADKLTQESINSIVTPTNFASGCTLTINTTPFQYITEEQKQALVDAGVTLVEYIPTETTE